MDAPVSCPLTIGLRWRAVRGSESLVAPKVLMRRFQTSLLASLLLALSPLTAVGQNLTEAVGIALSQYPSIIAAEARVQSADSDIITARSGHLPQVSWQGTNNVYSGVPTTPFQPSNTWIQSPAVNVNLWSGWRIQSGVERARAVFDSRKQQQRITRDEVAFLVVEAYLNWVRTAELIRLAQRNLAAHERLRSDVIKIAQVDQGRQIDVQQAEVRLENASLSLRQRESEHEIFSQRLRRMLLGRLPPHPSGYETIRGAFPGNPDQALSFINDAHPLIAQQLSEIEAAQAAVRSARSGFSPTVNLSYQKQISQGTGQGDYITQLNVNVPIFDGGSAYGSTLSAQSLVEAAQQALNEARITLRERLLSSWSEFSSAKQRAALGKRQVATALKLVVGYDQQFRVGRRSLLDLLTIQDNLYSYETQATNAAFEQKIAQARIMAVLNRLALAYQAPGDDGIASSNINSASGSRPSVVAADGTLIHGGSANRLSVTEATSGTLRNATPSSRTLGNASGGSTAQVGSSPNTQSPPAPRPQRIESPIIEN